MVTHRATGDLPCGGEIVPSASVRLKADSIPDYVGNSPEVVGHLLRGLGHEPAHAGDEVQVGFPGANIEPTYLGSPEWDIHGEARGDDAVELAVAATAAAMEEGRSRT